MAEIKITADASQAKKEIRGVESALQELDKFNASVAKGLLGMTAAAAGMAYAINSALESSGAIVDAANAIGMSATTLQTFQMAAIKTGVDAEQLNNSLLKMSANMGDAITKGAGPASDALKRLGIPIADIATMKPDEQFKRIADALNGMSDPAQRNALAMDLLGKQGPRLLEMAKGLEASKKEMEALGLALTEADFAALDRAGDSVDELQGLFSAGLKKAVAEIAPYIITIVEKIKEAIKEAGGFEAIWQKIKDAIKTALNIAVFTAVILALTKAVSAAIALRIAIKEAGVAMGLFNAIVMRNPLMLAVGAALVLAKVLGLDVTSAMSDYLGLSEGAAGVTKEIADAAAATADSTGQTNDLQQQLNDKQQKYLDALGVIIANKANDLQYAKDILKLGESEAKIRKALSDQDIKAKTEGLKLDDEKYKKQRLILEGLLREEELVKQINDRKKAVNTAITGMQDPQTQVRVGAYTELQKSYETYNNAVKLGDQELIASSKAQLDTLAIGYEDQIIRFAKSKDSMLKLEMDYNDGIRSLTEAEQGLKAIGYKEEDALFQAMQNQKLSLEKQYSEERVALATATAKKLEDLELARIRRQLMAERGGQAEILAASDAALLQKIGSEERQRAVVDERIAFEKKSDSEKTKFAIDNLQSVFGALGAQNKKAFEANKALAIASALVNTYMGATKALAMYPWPFGLIAAAAAVAAGFAQVSAIRSQQYSGRALGGPVMGGQSYMVGENGPELFTPQGTGSITRNGDLQSGSNVEVNFTIVANDTQGFDQLLTSRKGVIQQIISDAMLERGQRSMV